MPSSEAHTTRVWRRVAYPRWSRHDLTFVPASVLQILQDKMEKQRLDRIKSEARQAAKKEKLAAESEQVAQFVPVPERRSGRTAAEEATITERMKGDAKTKGKETGGSKRKVDKREMENALQEAVGSTSVRRALIPGQEPLEEDGLELQAYICSHVSRRRIRRPNRTPSRSLPRPLLNTARSPPSLLALSCAITSWQVSSGSSRFTRMA